MTIDLPSEPWRRLNMRSDTLIPLGTWPVRAHDAAGNEGEIQATFRIMKRISRAAATELRAPESGIDVLVIDEDYASWDAHKLLKAQVLGYRVYREPQQHQPRTYQLEDGRLFHLVLLRQRVAVEGLQGYGQIDWREGSGIVSVRGIALEDGKFDDLKPLWNALQVIGHIRVKPGPKAGTVRGQKYKTRLEWHAAIREHVLTKRTILTTDDETIACWLSISRSQLYALMKRWGPPRTLDDLRHGRF